ncbi:primosomal protein N' [Hoyosella altamirensis]|uniref:Probable replication restart protein PriA n=1 Tax=Hoyosella altamirensis TaxID=616997 RepID=A0A839RV36_9ACTN|nr:primosomal protein N' [Hoyosella altamirensis]MBB3039914.1 primosomal protein N' (replication factor Y) [Hoyosella altamirensis]
MLPLPHLDREFDYLIPAELDEQAQPGVRVRVRFAGRLVDGYLVDRAQTSEREGKLGWLDRVVSPVQVLTPEISRLVDAIAERYAGTRADVLRLAIPPRHARIESENRAPVDPPVNAAPDVSAWSTYTLGPELCEALGDGKAARAVWQAAPGEQWPRRCAELAGQVAATGRGAIIVVPDQRDLDRVADACNEIIGTGTVSVLSAGLGPAQRYRRWLAALRGDARVVVGTRSAMFAPVHNLGLIVVWDDGDDLHAEPRSPYPHVRDVSIQRAHLSGAAFVSAGFARTCESQLLVESGWAQEVVAPRAEVRARAPRIVALADSEAALVRDPAARAARLPAIAFAAARDALARDEPVLVQVPRRGYVPALACQDCRAPLRCRVCAGPMEMVSEDGRQAFRCRWCATRVGAPKCDACGSGRIRAQVVGARRTAEELGRAFPGVPVLTSGGEAVLASVQQRKSLVVCTPGAEPVADAGYGAALLLDGWALLGRADLRVSEDALRKWMLACTLVKPASAGGMVVVVADSGIPVVQALIRWDPAGFADVELRQREEVGFPPAVKMIAIDGDSAAVADFVAHGEMPQGTDVLGPVPLPSGARLPVQGAGADPEDVERVLLRTGRRSGAALAGEVRKVQAVRSAQKGAGPVRVQVDPLHIG